MAPLLQWRSLSSAFACALAASSSSSFVDRAAVALRSFDCQTGMSCADAALGCVIGLRASLPFVELSTGSNG